MQARMKTAWRLLLCVTLCLGTGQALSAQGFVPWVGEMVNRLTQPSRKLDSTAVWQMPPKWNASLGSELRQIFANQTSEMTLSGAPASLSLGISDHLYTGVGFQGGYAGLTLGYSNDFNRQRNRPRKQRNRTFSFQLQGAGYGFQALYGDLWEPISYELTTEGGTTSGLSSQLGRMRLLVAEGFYAFNQTTFVYSSAYSGGKFQTSTRGSWLLSAKYTQGDIFVDSDESLSSMLYGLTGQGVAQLSLGGGYSANLVPYYHAPADASGRGLRNLTVNLTAMPMIPLFDRHRSSRNVTDPTTGTVKTVKEQTIPPSHWPGLTARAGVCYAWDSYFVSLSGQYERSYFKGSNQFVSNQVPVKITTAGHFNRWSAVLRFKKVF